MSAGSGVKVPDIQILALVASQGFTYVLHLLILFASLRVGVCDATACMYGSEDNLWDLFFAFYYKGPRYHIPAIRLDSEHF